MVTSDLHGQSRHGRMHSYSYRWQWSEILKIKSLQQHAKLGKMTYCCNCFQYHVADLGTRVCRMKYFTEWDFFFVGGRWNFASSKRKFPMALTYFEISRRMHGCICAVKSADRVKTVTHVTPCYMAPPIVVHFNYVKVCCRVFIINCCTFSVATATAWNSCPAY